MIKIEDLRKYCMEKKGVNEDFPFDFSILTFKVLNKIFVLTDINSEVFRINLKCTPEHALTLRSIYPQITPGYHMNKKHWNTIEIDGTIPDEEIYKMIDQSYELVLAGVKKSLRESL